MKKTQIILVDDQPVYRNAMKTLLHKIENVEIIAEASNGYEFLELLDRHIPDVVFMDIEMPGMNGIDATQKGIQKMPGLIIIGLSLYDNDNYIDELIKAGARGYLLKLSNNYDIFKTIVKYPDAEIFFSKEIEYQSVAPTETKNILIVDDFKNTRFIIKHVLENAGYNVMEAMDGSVALNFFQGDKIDLLITDYFMPKMNGLELVKKIKKSNDYQNIPVIVLSNEINEELQNEALSIGVYSWITKPFNTKMFITTVEKALKSKNTSTL